MRDSTSDGDYLDASDLTQYYYCKRKVFFLKVAGVPAPTRRKMAAGKEEQEQEYRRLLERKDLFGIPREQVLEAKPKVYLVSQRLRLKGVVDLLLVLKDGQAVPVEFKYTDETELTLSRRKQLTAYIVLCEEALGKKCPYGILYFTQQNLTLKVTPTEGDRAAIARDLEEIWRMFATETLPRRAPEWKCGYCEVKRYCWT